KSQVALKSLINHVNITNILEILEVKHMATNTSSTNYVALCHDYSHICTSLGRKLATLAAEFNLTHVLATMWGLIEQVEQIEQSNINSTSDNRSQEIVQNPSQASAKGRPAKRLKSCVENNSKKSNSKQINTNVHSEDAYTCQNCCANGYNAR
ncbi:566_t:CDS:2, partial [Funneliformis caledonium]